MLFFGQYNHILVRNKLDRNATLSSVMIYTGFIFGLEIASYL